MHTLTERARALLKWVLAHKVVAGVSAVVIVGAGMLIFGNGNGKLETLVVHPGEFVQEVSVSGTVTAVSDVDLGFSQGGRVLGVYAKVGQRVGMGQVLIELENGEARATVQKEEAALAALVRGTRPEEIAVAEAAVARDQDALDKAIESAFVTADGAVKTDVDQFFSNISSASPQLAFSVSDSALKNTLERGRGEVGVALAAWKPSNAEATLALIERFLGDAQAALARSIATGSITQTTLDGYAADIAGARTAVSEARAAVSAARASLSEDQKTLDLKKAGTTAEDIAGQKARVAEAEAALRKTLVIAPFSGVVTAVPAKTGSILSASATAISVIGTDFQIESYVPEVNISLVKVGDLAAITLDAYPDVEFRARVASIDPAETVRDGVSMYRAVLVFDAPDPRIRSGMTANVRITTLEKSNVIAVPQGLVIEEGGAKHVTVTLDGKTSEARTVTTGALSSSGLVEIVAGLSDGDTVVVPAR